MSHGTIELDDPRDHTGDALEAAAQAAANVHQWARDNVRDAERGLELARLAEQRAAENVRAACEEIRTYRDKPRA